MIPTSSTSQTQQSLVFGTRVNPLKQVRTPNSMSPQGVTTNETIKKISKAKNLSPEELINLSCSFAALRASEICGGATGHCVEKNLKAKNEIVTKIFFATPEDAKRFLEYLIGYLTLFGCKEIDNAPPYINKSGTAVILPQSCMTAIADCYLTLTNPNAVITVLSQQEQTINQLDAGNEKKLFENTGRIKAIADLFFVAVNSTRDDYETTSLIARAFHYLLEAIKSLITSKEAENQGLIQTLINVQVDAGNAQLGLKHAKISPKEIDSIFSKMRDRVREMLSFDLGTIGIDNLKLLKKEAENIKINLTTLQSSEKIDSVLYENIGAIINTLELVVIPEIDKRITSLSSTATTSAPMNAYPLQSQPSSTTPHYSSAVNIEQLSQNQVGLLQQYLLPNHQQPQNQTTSSTTTTATTSTSINQGELDSYQKQLTDLNYFFNVYYDAAFGEFVQKDDINVRSELLLYYLKKEEEITKIYQKVTNLKSRRDELISPSDDDKIERMCSNAMTLLSACDKAIEAAREISQSGTATTITAGQTVPVPKTASAATPASVTTSLTTNTATTSRIKSQKSIELATKFKSLKENFGKCKTDKEKRFIIREIVSLCNVAYLAHLLNGADPDLRDIYADAQSFFKKAEAEAKQDIIIFLADANKYLDGLSIQDIKNSGNKVKRKDALEELGKIIDKANEITKNDNPSDPNIAKKVVNAKERAEEFIKQLNQAGVTTDITTTTSTAASVQTAISAVTQVPTATPASATTRSAATSLTTTTVSAATTSTAVAAISTTTATIAKTPVPTTQAGQTASVPAATSASATTSSTATKAPAQTQTQTSIQVQVSTATAAITEEEKKAIDSFFTKEEAGCIKLTREYLAPFFKELYEKKPVHYHLDSLLTYFLSKACALKYFDTEFLIIGLLTSCENKKIEIENPINKDEQQRQKEDLLDNYLKKLDLFIEKIGNKKQYPYYSKVIKEFKEKINNLLQTEPALQNTKNQGYKDGIIKRLKVLLNKADSLLSDANGNIAAPVVVTAIATVQAAVPAAAIANPAAKSTTTNTSTTATTTTTASDTAKTAQTAANQPIVPMAATADQKSALTEGCQTTPEELNKYSDFYDIANHVLIRLTTPECVRAAGCAAVGVDIFIELLRRFSHDSIAPFIEDPELITVLKIAALYDVGRINKNDPHADTNEENAKRCKEFLIKLGFSQDKAQLAYNIISNNNSTKTTSKAEEVCGLILHDINLMRTMCSGEQQQSFNYKELSFYKEIAEKNWTAHKDLLRVIEGQKKVRNRMGDSPKPLQIRAENGEKDTSEEKRREVVRISLPGCCSVGAKPVIINPLQPYADIHRMFFQNHNLSPFFENVYVEIPVWQAGAEDKPNGDCFGALPKRARATDVKLPQRQPANAEKLPYYAEVKSRGIENLEYVNTTSLAFKGNYRPPEEVFETGGIPAFGVLLDTKEKPALSEESLNVGRHQSSTNNGPTSAVLSCTISPRIGLCFSRLKYMESPLSNGYVYGVKAHGVITSPNTGVVGEEEFSVIGMIPTKEIIIYRETGPADPNFHFSPDIFVGSIFFKEEDLRKIPREEAVKCCQLLLNLDTKDTKEVFHFPIKSNNAPTQEKTKSISEITNDLQQIEAQLQQPQTLYQLQDLQERLEEINLGLGDDKEKLNEEKNKLYKKINERINYLQNQIDKLEQIEAQLQQPQNIEQLNKLLNALQEIKPLDDQEELNTQKTRLYNETSGKIHSIEQINNQKAEPAVSTATAAITDEEKKQREQASIASLTNSCNRSILLNGNPKIENGNTAAAIQQPSMKQEISCKRSYSGSVKTESA